VELGEFQDVIRRTYRTRDAARGVDGTFRWMVEEVGELARALRLEDDANREHEVGDVLAWLASVASIAGVDLDQAASRYAHGCPRCGAIPCACPPR
jgi:NTP pyrophosphatase (non-canonical NTP hydrolase)